MSESKLKKTATQKLIEQFPNCALCGGLRLTTTREHCPPLALFYKSHRPDGFVVPSCQECQDKTRIADTVVSIMSRWGYAPDDDIIGDHERLARGLRHNAPEIVEEWLSLGLIERERAKKTLIARNIHAPDNSIVKVGKKTIPHLNIFSQKFAMASHFTLTGRILSKNSQIWTTWRTKEDIQSNPIPEEFKSLLGPANSLTQGKWDSHRHFQYRSSFNVNNGIFAIYARFNVAFLVIALISENGDFKDDPDWLCPETAFQQAMVSHRLG